MENKEISKDELKARLAKINDLLMMPTSPRVRNELNATKAAILSQIVALETSAMAEVLK